MSEEKILIGILVDVSGSMTSAIGNTHGRSLNRLQAFQNSLEELAMRAATSAEHPTDAGTSPYLFTYGFGFGNALSLLIGGSGSPVRDLLRSPTSNTSTITLQELAVNWQKYRSHVESLAIHMFGDTPMRQAFEMASKRFDEEEAVLKPTSKILLLVSDGDPTDGSLASISHLAATLKQRGVVVVSCYITNADVTRNRTLYEEASDTWPAGAQLMFECASNLPAESPFRSYLLEHNWQFPPRAKLFTQINQSESLSEFMGMLARVRGPAQDVLAPTHNDDHSQPSVRFRPVMNEEKNWDSEIKRTEPLPATKASQEKEPSTLSAGEPHTMRTHQYFYVVGISFLFLVSLLIVSGIVGYFMGSFLRALAMTGCLLFFIGLPAIALAVPQPTDFQYSIFRTYLALSAAGAAAGLPGFFSFEAQNAQVTFSAGGALAVFAFVYWLNPAKRNVEAKKSRTIV